MVEMKGEVVPCHFSLEILSSRENFLLNGLVINLFVVIVVCIFIVIVLLLEQSITVEVFSRDYAWRHL
jgi:hypothetical protein